jgi:hypothetical protein
MMRTSWGDIASMKASARGPSVTRVMRSSVERIARETIEVATIETMKMDAILRPSGRSWTFVTRV